MRIALAVVLLVTLGSMCFGQAPAASLAKREAMAKLEFLVGEWRGGGWIERGGKRYEFTSTETIQSKLDGVVLLIEGVHTRFKAMAVVTYDEKAQAYNWRSYTSEGGGAEVEAKLIGPRTLQWGRDGSFRYTIAISDDGTWREVGERSADGGKTWVQFHEMTLRKVGGA